MEIIHFLILKISILNQQKISFIYHILGIKNNEKFKFGINICIDSNGFPVNLKIYDKNFIY